MMMFIKKISGDILKKEGSFYITILFIIIFGGVSLGGISVQTDSQKEISDTVTVIKTEIPMIKEDVSNLKKKMELMSEDVSEIKGLIKGALKDSSMRKRLIDD